MQNTDVRTNSWRTPFLEKENGEDENWTMTIYGRLEQQLYFEKALNK